MPQLTSVNIISNLSDYVMLLKKLTSLLLEIDKEDPDRDMAMVPTVSLEYGTIKMLLHTKSTEQNLVLQTVFDLQHGLGILKDMYCLNPKASREISKLISESNVNAAIPWDTHGKQINLSSDVINYLEISDRIAQQAYLCASGDDYHPGYFSSTVIKDGAITLEQINRHNSRSIDHKRDYHMRDLKITIPLQPIHGESPFCDFRIGDMMIEFSDTSSEQNRTCGKRIVHKIEEEAAKFGSV